MSLKNFFVGLFLSSLLWCSPAVAQTPTLGGGPGAATILGGGPTSFPLSLTNAGPPGFGPYIRLILPVGVTFDGASTLGSAASTQAVGVFPPAPGNQLVDPITGDFVTGPEGGTFTILTYPVGSVVAGAPPLVMNVNVTVDPSSPIGVPLNISATPVYRFGDTPTGDNGPIVGAPLNDTITPILFELFKSLDSAEEERSPGPSWPITYTLRVDVAEGRTLENVSLLDTLPADLQFVSGPVITGGAGCTPTTVPSLVTPGGTLQIDCPTLTGTAGGNDLLITYTAYIIDTLDETNCTDELLTNTVTLDAEFPAGVSQPQLMEMSQITADHFPIQKGLAPGTGVPGQTVTFTLNMQLSDFADANAAVVTDVLPDGYTFDAHQSFTFNGGAFAIVPVVTAMGDGSTTIVYDLTAVTGNIAPGSSLALTYTATVDQDFTPGPDPILANDSLTNNVSLAYGLVQGAGGCDNTSSATFTVLPVDFTKQVLVQQPMNQPGDVITYRLTLEVPSGNTESILYQDFFPLPVHDVDSLNLTFGTDIRLAANDTLGLTPTMISIDSAQNSLSIIWPPVVSNSPETLAIDVDIVIEDEPFADGLFQTNLAQVSTANSPGVTSSATSPVQILVFAPDLTITKGVAASTNPVANATISPSPAVLPIDGDISQSDAGDTITFVTTLFNDGGAPAFDVVVTDPVVPGLTNVTLVSVEDGDGNPLATTGTLATGLMITAGLSSDDGAAGGTDTAIVTYTADIASSVAPESQLVNTATAEWGSGVGAMSFPAISDNATVSMAAGSIAKTIDSVSPGGAGAGLVTSGDTVTYRIAVTLPEGQTDSLQVIDNLPPGIGFTGFSVDTTGFAGTVDTTPTASNMGTVNGGQTITFSFNSPNTTTVTDDNNPANNTFSLLVFALVDGSSTSNDGLPVIQNKTNQANLDYTGRTAPISDSVSTDFAEPELSVTKSMSPDTGLDAGDTVTVTLTVNNDGTAPAYDVVVTDVLNDAGILFDLASVLEGTTPAGFSFGYASPTVTYMQTAGSIAAGSSVQFTFTAQINALVNPQATLSNAASATGDSQDGVVTGERSTSDTGSDSVQIAAGAVAKTIDSISPGGAGGGNITSGDTVTYRLTVTLPEGRTNNVVLTDSLPAGLSFVNAVVDTTGFAGTVDTTPTTGTSGAVATGQTVMISFDSPLATDVTADNNPANNSFSVLVSALVDGTIGSNDGLPAVQNKTNTVSLDYTGRIGTISDDVSTNFAEPELNVTKTMSPDSGLDAGDTITVTILVENTGTSPAYDVVVTDTLNDDGTLFDLTTVSEVTTPAGFSFAYASPTVTYTLNAGSIAAGGSATFTFTAEANTDVNSGSSFGNTAAAIGDSQDGPVAGERSTSDTGTDTVSTQAASTGKIILDSSESWTGGNPELLAIGEVVTYQLAFTLPEGLTQEDGTNAIITDTLPAGFAYQTGTAMIRAVTDASISGSNFGAVPTTDVAVVPMVSGQDLEFDLGDLTVTDDDGNAEQLILTYDVLVLNTTDNNRNNTKTNTGSLNYLNRDGMPQTVSDSTTARVAEPRLTVNKSASPTSVTGGATVTFTVVVGNTSGGSSTRTWEPVLTDMLPTRYNSPVVTSAVLSRGAVDVSGSASFAGNTLTADLSSLAAAEQYIAPGETLTVIYTAIVDPAVNFEEQIDNTASVLGTSLPGSNGTGAATPGAPGDSTGERTGSGLPNELGQNVNDLNNNDTATVTANRPTVTKTGDANLQIGETTNMTVEISVPVGTTSNFVLTDNLPTGLSYTGTAISIVTPAMNFSASNSPSTTPGAGTDPLVFDFGNVTNSGMTAQSITITYEVQVLNILGNQNNAALQNIATLSYTGASMPLAADSATITVVEPNLDINKTITAGATGRDAGGTISFQVVIQNTSSAGTAYAVGLDDVLPAELLGAPDGTGSTSPFFLSIGLTNPGGAAVLSSDGVTPLASGDASFLTTNVTDDTLTWPDFNLPPSTTLTITYDVIVANTAEAGQMLTNNVTATYQSSEAINGQTRDNSDSNDDDDGNLDNYGETDSATVTIDSNIAISKSLNAIHPDNIFTIGEVITFDVRVDVIEGVKTNVTVTDVLPSGLLFQGPVSIVAAPNISFDGTGVAIEAPAGTLTIPMGNITNIADGNPANDFFIIEIDALVENVVGNANGDMLTNSASLTSDVGPAGPATQTIVIGEPDLGITKTPSTTMPSLGDEFTYTVTVRHSMASMSDAFEVVLTDVIPAGLTYVVGSTMGQATVDESDPAAPEFDLGTITLAELEKTFSFNVRLDLDATVGTPINNVIDADYSSLSGDDPNERDYTGQGSGEVTPATPAIIEADKTVAISMDAGNIGIADPGDELTYTVILTNGSTTVNNVVFTDTLPSVTTYVPTSLTSSVGGEDDSSAPDLVVNVGTMNPADVVTITFSVTVNGGTPAGTVISNQGVVDSDETVPEPTDSDGTDANGDQPTDITVGGPPPAVQALYVQKVVSWEDDVDTSGDITAGDRMRYTLIFENTGDEDLTNVSLTDVIPMGLTYVGASASISSGGDTITVVGSDVTVAIALLGVKQTITASFDVTIDAFIPAMMTYTNQGTADSDQTDPILTDSNGDPTDGSQPTEFMAVNGMTGAPALDHEKRWVLAVDVDGDGLVDPGDELEYRLTLLNTGSATATNVRITDTTPTDTTFVLGSAATSVGVIVGEDPLNVNIGDLMPGELATITFNVTVDGGTPNGTIIPNQATATADNAPDAPSDDNGDDSDGLNPTLTPVSTDGVVGTPMGLTKTLIATSEAGSTGTDVFIGEVVTFEVAVEVPAGTLGEVTLIDTLPTGFAYLTGTAQLAREFDTGLTSSTNPGGINSAATGTFVNLADGSDIELNGSALTVFLGDIINSDNDMSAERYRLRINLLVENIMANQAGSDLTNQAGLSFADQLGQIQNLTPVTSTVTVVEAALQAAKTVDPLLVLTDGGDVTYTFTVTNPSGANVGPGYDVSIVDMLPATFTGLTVDSITPTGGVSGVTDNSAGTTLDVDVAVFPPDGSLVIVATATLPGSLTDGSTITNTLTVNWTSLPGSNGTGSATPGNSGDADGERTGGGGVNDLTTTAMSDLEVGDATLTKTILNPQTRYAIGDLVEYQVIIALPPQAEFADAAFTDILLDGLAYDTGSLAIMIPAGVTATLNPTDFSVSNDDPGAGDQTLSLDWGTLDNTNNGIAQVTLTYMALVENILANQNNGSLSNDAAFSFTDPGGGGTVMIDDDVSLTIGEPHLALTKGIISPAVGLDAGDSITFEITVTSDGTTTAFDTVLTDVLPTGLENVTGLMVTNVTGGAETPTFTNNGTDWVSSAFDIPAGGSVTIQFSATISVSVIPGQTIQNNVTATFDSRDGSDANSRDGSTPDSNQDDDSDLNNYNTEANSPIVTIDSPVAIDKSFFPDPANTTYTIGETFIYRVRVELVEGTINNLVVTDVLPDDVTFISSTVGLGNLGITTGYMPPPVEAGQMLTFDLGDVVNPGDADDTNDFITIDMTVQIDDVPANVDGSILGNNASLTYDGPGGPVTIDYDADAGTPGVQPLDLTIVEPDLTVTKAAAPTMPSLGDEVTYTITVDHTALSTADAFDVVLTDVIPTGLTYILGSTMGQATADEMDPSAPIFNVGVVTLAEDQKIFTFRVRVEESATVGAPITNTISMAYSTLPGAEPNERTYSDEDMATVTPTAAAVIEADKTVAISMDAGNIGIADPGDELTYTVILTNGSTTVTNAVFTDTLPSVTTYVPGSLTSSVGGEDDSSAPDLLVNLGTMNPADVVTITFRVTINAGTPEGTVVSNQGVVDSDQTVPEPTDSDGTDANGDQPTDITVGGPPPAVQALYVQKVVSWEDDVDTSGDITAGDRMRYTLIFENTGDEDLTNVSLTDVIPMGLTYVTSSAAISSVGDTITVVGSNVTVAIAILPVKQTITATFDVTIDVFVPTMMTYTNQGTANSDQTDPILTDSNGDPTDGSQPTEFMAVNGVPGSPELDLEKRWVLAVDVDGDGLVDPGDELQYSLTLLNTGSATATNVRINDDTPPDTTFVTGSAATSIGAIVSEDPLNVNIGDLMPGELVTITFNVTVDAGTPNGTIIPNQALATADNAPDTPSDDNGDDSDGLNPTLTPVSTDGMVGTPMGLSKTLVDSTEPDSGGSQLFIGELVTFDISVDVPAGTLGEVTLLDTLPTGLAYVPGTAELARTFDTGLTSSVNPGGINSAASGNLVALTDGTDLQINGSQLSVFLGDIINSDNDANGEAYRLRLQFLVENIAANQAGSVLTNQAGLSFADQLGQIQNLTPVTSDVTLVEANVQIAKTVEPILLLVDGGTVTFTFTVTNPSAANAGPAYDMAIQDMLPAAFSGLTINSIIPTAGIMGLVDNSAGTTLDISIDVFPVDESVVITAEATLPGPIALGTTVSNNVTARWTSLPGTNGTGDATAGNPGDPDGERTGNGVGVNDLVATDSADVLIGEAALTKSIVNPQTRYAIGDTVDYQVLVEIPPGAVLDDGLFTDILGEGLVYETGTLMTQIATDISLGSNPTDFTVMPDSPNPGEDQLSLDWGTVSNAGTGIGQITLTYQARVENILANQNNTTLSNNATFSFTDPGGSGGTISESDTTMVTVGEPHLAMNKFIISPTVGLNAGDSLSYQVVVENDGTSTAFDVVLSDSLPVGLENITNLMVTAANGGAETPMLTNNGSDWFTSAFDLPVAASITIEFTTTLSVGVIPGQTIQNNVSATFQSQDGMNANGRDGSTPDSNQDDDGDLNNYNVDAMAPVVTVDNPVAINKAFFPDPANTTYTIGEVFSYRLTIDIIEGTKNDLVITDVLPDGVTLMSTQVGLGNLGITTEYMPPAMESGQTVTFDLGQVVNPGDADPLNDFITIDLEVQLNNIPANQNGVVLGNNASLTFTGPSGPETVEFDADAGTPGVQPLDLTIVEPELSLAKMTKSTLVSVGDEVTFTLTLAHTMASTSDAFEIELIDTLPPGLVYVLGSGSLTPVVNGNQLIFSVASLSLTDGSLDITYRVRVESTEIGQPLMNSAVATYQTLPGDDGEIRTGTDGPGGLNDLETNEANAVVIPQGPFLDAPKTAALTNDVDMDGVVSPGDTLTYTIVLTNSGNGPATGVSFNDILDTNLTLISGSVTATQGTIILGNNPGDSTIEINVGDVPGNNGSVTITFEAMVNDPFPPDVNQVENQGVFASGEIMMVLTDDPDTPEEDDPTVTPVLTGPQLAITKVDSVVINPDGIVGPGDTIEYTLAIENSGNGTSGALVLDDTPDANTMLEVGSVTTSQGTVTQGNGAGDTSVTVDIGALAAMTTVTVTFRVTINDPLPAGVNQVVNQATLSENGTPLVDSDDPDVGGPEDPTVTPLGDSPMLTASKTDDLTVDGNGNMALDPGDTLTYTITIANSGNGDADNVSFSDIIDTNLNLVVGSVTTTQGTVITGNTAGDVSVQVDVGTLLAGGMATITFQVTLVDPLPDGVTMVSNQGVVSSPDTTDVLTDDPDVPGDDDPTDTPIGTSPVLFASKSDALLVDDGDGIASPGDTLRYTILIGNNGSGDATNVVLDDIPDSNTTLIVGSVTTTQGMVTTGNTAGDTAVSVAIGTMTPGSNVTVTFDVLINDPLPQGVTRIRNQGSVSSTELPDLPTDDPDGPGDDDPTDTPLGTDPELSASKTDTLLIDADDNGVASPGDTLAYTVVITNSGNGSATGVMFTDTPDANTSLVAGSVATTQGSILSGNDGNPPIGIDIGLIMPGASVEISFQVTVNSPLPDGVTSVENQGTVSSTDGPTVSTDDPDTPEDDDSTTTPVGTDPILEAIKQDSLIVDADMDGMPSPGDSLLYQITIRNSGNGSATGVVFSDTPDANTTIVPGSVQTSQGAITSGQAGTPPVVVDIGAMPAGTEVQISFRVQINDPLPNGVNQVVNQGTVDSDDLPTVRTDDPDVPGDEDPNVTPLGTAPIIRASKTDALLDDADGNGIASPGDTLLYQITISNLGNGAGVNLVFSDTPDPLTSIVAGSVQTSQGVVTSGNDGNPPITVAIGNLAPAGVVTISFEVVIADVIPAGVMVLVNQGVVSGDNTVDVPTDDPDTTEPDDDTETPLGTDPILTASKTDILVIDADAIPGPSAGDTLEYIVTIENSGNGEATNVVFTDTPDANTTLVAGSVQTTSGTVTGGQAGTPPVVVDIGTIPPGGSVTISFRVTINDPVPPGVTEVSNQGTVISDELPDVQTDDPDTPDEDDTTDTPLGSEPNIRATKTDTLVIDLNNEGAASPGDTLSYTVTLINTGNGTATEVFFEDTPDANTSLVAGTVQTSQGQVLTGNDGTPPILVAVGDMGPGQMVTITFRVTINDPFPTNVSQVANQGLVRGGGITDTPTDDPDTTDPEDDTETPVVQADLVVVKTAPSTPIVAGLPFDYTIVVTNQGPDDATNVVLVDTLPAEVAFVNSTTTQGVCVYDAMTHTMTCDLGDLAVGEDVTIILTVDVLEEGMFTNSVTVRGDQHDPDGGNNDSDAEVNGQPGIDLELEKTVNNPKPDLNQNVIYTLSLTNLGPDVATGVVVRDVLPVGTTYLNDTASLGTYDPGTGLWSIAALGVNETATLDIEVQVVGIGSIVNDAEVIDADQTDIDSTPDNGPGEDDDDSVEIQVNTLVDLRITKTVEQVYVRPGDVVNYTIMVENLGPDTANNVMVVEALPMGLTAINAVASMGTFDPITRIWSVGTLVVTDGAILELEAVVDENIFGELINIATVSADEPDVNPSDNTDEASVQSLAPVPTLSPLGLLILLIGLVGSAIWFKKRAQRQEQEMARSES